LGYGFSPRNGRAVSRVRSREREKLETRRAKKSRKTEMPQVESAIVTISEEGASSSCSRV
jgi:hypothetical protein